MEAPNEGLCEWICISLILNCLQCCDDSHSNERMCDVNLCREVWPHFRFPALFILPWIEDAPPAVFLTRCTSSPLHTKFYNSDRYSNLNSYVTAYK